MVVRNPLVVPFVGLAAGILVSRRLEFEARPVALAAIALVVLSVVAARKVSRRTGLIATCAAFVQAGILIDLHHRPPPPPQIDFTPGERLVLEGCVVEPPAFGADREQFVLELEPGARVRVNWYVRDGEQPPRLHYGQRVEIEARLRRPRNYGNPGAFDFVGYLARRDIYWLASVNSRSAPRVTGTCKNHLLGWVYGARQAALERLDHLYANDPFAAGMLRATLVGDTARLEQQWVDSFRRTGTYHALVISGLHLTTLTTCLVFFLRVLSVGVGWSLLLTAGLAWAYALVAGGAAPVVRAAAGLTLFLTGRWFYRKPLVVNLLAAVGIVFLLSDPAQLFDPSFQLSFLSVALIGAIAIPVLEQTTDPYERGTRSLGNLRWDGHLPPRVAQMRVEWRLVAETLAWCFRIPSSASLMVASLLARFGFFFWNLLIVSAVVQFGLALPLICYFHANSYSGLTANLLVVPLMNAVIPVGFLALATGWPWPAEWAAWLIHAASRVAGWHAEHDPGGRVPEPPEWLFWAFLLALVLSAVAVGRGRLPGDARKTELRRRPDGGVCLSGLMRAARPFALRILAGASFAAAFLILVTHPFEPPMTPGTLEVTAVDVGQGDSTWIQAPEGQHMLVDTGGLLAYGRRRTNFDIGEEVVSDYLFTRSIRHIDVVALTHAHEDHIGGLRAIVDNFRPREVWTGALPDAEPWTLLRDHLRRAGVRIIAPRAGERRRWGGVDIEFLSPPPEYETSGKPNNNDSLVFRLQYGSGSFLMTGDVERAMEYRMAGSGLLQPTDVLKVAHHGSRTSSTDEFLEAVRPTWAIISSGADNQFRHPHPEVLERLARRGVRLLRTDQSGQITIRTDGRRWTIGCYFCAGFANEY
jgi:competence protein ComEC